jgi:hypothetical protein
MMASGGMIYISTRSFMIIGVGFQDILRFYFNSLRGCNVGVNDGKDL